VTDDLAVGTAKAAAKVSANGFGDYLEPTTRQLPTYNNVSM